MIKRAREALRNRCATCAMTTLIFGGAAVGLVIAGLLMAGGAYGLAWTNTEGFCISCHKMRSNPYAEYQDTIHDKEPQRRARHLLGLPRAAPAGADDRTQGRGDLRAVGGGFFGVSGYYRWW